MSENNKLAFIDNELKKFNVSDAAIAELAQQYMPLLISGIDDKDGQKRVKEARSIVKRYRIDVDKRRKELSYVALEYQRRINGEAKRITEQLQPIEQHLEAQEKAVADEIERIRREKEEAEIACYLARVKKLEGIDFKFDGVGVRYFTEYLDTFYNEIIQIPILHLSQLDDSAFIEFYDNAKHHWIIHKQAIETQKAQDEAERQARAVQRRELEMENERLADIARKKEIELGGFNMSNAFSYERYLAGEKVTTRNGEEVLSIYCCPVSCDCEIPITFIYRDEYGCVHSDSCQANGTCDDTECSLDLIMAPKTIDLCIIIKKYPIDDGTRSTSRAYESGVSVSHLDTEDAFIAKITVNTDTWEQVLEK